MRIVTIAFLSAVTLFLLAPSAVTRNVPNTYVGIPGPGLIAPASGVNNQRQRTVPVNLVSTHSDRLHLAAQSNSQDALILKANFGGISASNPVVPDPTLAVGPTSLILVTNGPLEIRTKTGGLVASTTLATFFGSVQTLNEGAYDPQIIFDPDSNRFFLAATGFVSDPGCTPGNCISNIFLAVSKTSDPATLSSVDWYFYAFDATLLGSTPTANWADRPRLGVDNSIVVTAFQTYRASDGEFMGEAVRIFDKSKLINGGSVTWTDFHGMAVEGDTLTQTMVPALHFDYPGTFFLLSHAASPGWSCETVWGISNPLSDPTLSYVPFSGHHLGCIPPPDAPQPDGGLPLPTGGNALQDGVVYRNGSLWTVRTLGQDFGSGNVSAIRWFQVDVSAWPNEVSYLQDANFGADGTFFFMPAIMVDAYNNVALVYARSSTTEYASVYYTGRLASDPPNTLRSGILLRAGSAAANYVDRFGQNRYGDFFGIASDPSDGTIWFVGEYAKTSNMWGTWVGNVEFTLQRRLFLPAIMNQTASTSE